MNIQLKSSELSIYRDKLLKEQNYKCAITGKDLSNERVVLDHQHDKGLKGSGNIRGVIGSNINVYLGKLENNCKRFGISLEDLPTVLRQIADYIDKGDYIDIDGNSYRHSTEAPKPKYIKKSCYNKLVKEYKGKVKLPIYKEKMKLSKALEKAFNLTGIEVEFY